MRSDGRVLSPGAAWPARVRHPHDPHALPSLLLLQLELLERVAVGGRQSAAHGEGPGHFADVDVTFRIDCEPVRRREAAGLRGFRRAPPREEAAVAVEDADAAVLRGLRGAVAARDLAGVPPELGHVGASGRVEDEVRRPLRVGPLAQILAVGAEDLDAVALAVADEDAAVGVDGDTVRDVELAGAGAGLAPRA